MNPRWPGESVAVAVTARRCPAALRRRDRQVWWGGAILMGIVLLKLITIDRGYMGNMPGIISFMAVGLLLVGVGWIAPQPPRLAESGGKA